MRSTIPPLTGSSTTTLLPKPSMPPATHVAERLQRKMTPLALLLLATVKLKSKMNTTLTICMNAWGDLIESQHAIWVMIYSDLYQSMKMKYTAWWKCWTFLNVVLLNKQASKVLDLKTLADPLHLFKTQKLPLFHYLQVIQKSRSETMLLEVMAQSKYLMTLQLNSSHPIKFFSNWVKFISEDKLKALKFSDSDLKWWLELITSSNFEQW